MVFERVVSNNSAVSLVPEPQEYDPHRTERVTSHEFLREHQNNLGGDHNGVVVNEFNQTEPTVIDFGKHHLSNPGSRAKAYFASLFPIAKWILHYNLSWLYGDFVAGITVGVVLVPQSMSYAQVALLPAQYGLYSSFIGVFIYCFFATSKDVSIGPVAVMSLQVSKVITKVQSKVGTDKYSSPEIATFLSLICGGIAAGLGLLRLGFILEFISMPAVMGFISGSAFSIITGQVPGLLGYNSAVNSRKSSFYTVVHTLKNLPLTNVNAAFGLVPLFLLYLWKFLCGYLGKRYPQKKMFFFYVAQLRNAIIIIVATAISWGIVHPELKRFSGPKSKFKSTIKTIGVVPSGLKDVGVMSIPSGILDDMASEIPVSTIILLLEHIAISKSFGRINDYKVVPDQELVAIGVNNLIGTFFKAYPSTGSFSRSALKAKCGVRTPLAGIFTGAVVLLALYCLTDSFFYIPKSTLCAVIIHAVSDLFPSWRASWNLWEVSPLDFGIFIIAVIITVFSSIENGVYFAVAASAAVHFFHVSHPHGQFLGKIRVAEVVNPSIKFDDQGSFSSSDTDVEIQQVLSRDSYNSTSINKTKVKNAIEKTSLPTAGELVTAYPNIRFDSRWVPLTKENLNDKLEILPPPPGVIVFRPVDSLVYPNSSKQVDRISDEAKRLTRRGRPYLSDSAGQRPWNDPGPLRFNLPFTKKRDVHTQEEDTRPLLRIVHIDLTCVANIDATSIQALVDLRRALNIYADREVEFHFSGINSGWIRRALIRGGFGTYGEVDLVSEKAFVNIATTEQDLENNAYYAAVGTNTPFFHLDIPDY